MMMSTPAILLMMVSLVNRNWPATVADAQAQASEAMSAVIVALTDSGVDEDDIQTQYYSINQITRWDKEGEQEVVTGYRVTNTVSAKIRDIDEVGAIIDAVAAAGGDLTRINGVSFSVDGPSAYYEEARELAMADAKTKAEELADLSGVELGKPTYIFEGGVYSPVISRDIVAPMVIESGSTSISAGQLEIILNIQVAYAILV